jgi:hypothetical protein
MSTNKSNRRTGTRARDPPVYSTLFEPTAPRVPHLLVLLPLLLAAGLLFLAVL